MSKRIGLSVSRPICFGFISFIVFNVISCGAQNWRGSGTEAPTENNFNNNGCNFTTVPNNCDLESHDLHCHDPDFDHIHLCIGESISIPNKCQLMTCIHYDGNVVMYRGCSALIPNEGCYLTEQDNTQLYPDCCPREECYDSDRKRKK